MLNPTMTLLHRLPRVVGFIVLLFGTAATLGLAPEPDVIPRRWQLAIQPGPLRVTAVESPGVGLRSYFYFTYRVTNTSPGDLLFAPIFDLCSNEGDCARGGRDVPPDVARQIWSSLENPELLDQIGIVGTLLTGEENSKEGLVIWPASNLQPEELTIYASGFSGETKVVPVIDPKTKKPATRTLRKSFMLRFEAAGELRGMNANPLRMIEERWIMR